MIQNMHGYVERLASKTINERLKNNPALAILGPRQCGKSTLSRLYKSERKILYLDLERPADLAKLSDAETFFRHNQECLICIDEIQRIPELFPVLRYQIDQINRPEQFLILGSASRELIRQSSESLAGRISYMELTPFLYEEVKDLYSLSSYQNRGGYPRSLLAESDEASYQWREDFIQSFIERDIPFLNPRLSPQLCSQILRMLAHHHGQILNYATLAKSLAVDGNTIKAYVELLEGAFIIRRLPAYSRNIGKRLVKSPKVYIRDSGILHALLGIPSWNDLCGHPIYGFSWESMSMENIIARLESGVHASFYRTSNGAEIDLILEKGLEQMAIEFKSNSAPKMERGFHSAVDDLNIERRWCIAPVDQAYTSKGTIFSDLEGLINHEGNGGFFHS